MRLDRLPSLQPAPRNRRWVIASAVLHAGLLTWALVYRPAALHRTVRYVDLGERGVDIAFAPPAGLAGVAAPRGRPPAPGADAVPSAPSPIIMAAPAPAPAGGAGGALAPDSVPTGTHRLLVPAYGDGRLWVRVGDVEAGELPARREAYDVATHVAQVDSALAEKIRSYLDTMPPDSFASGSAPKWTTEIAGQTWGIDGRWIYLGPIRIPTTILAMLPLPSGNYDQSQRAAQLQQMRDDIMQAAWRAQTAADFKRYVRELRERKDIERAAREVPEPPRDTLYP